MAQSRIQQPGLSELISAYKRTGPAEAVNAVTQGVSNGINLADAIRNKQLEQMMKINDFKLKVEDMKRKQDELTRKEAHDSAGEVPFTPHASTATIGTGPNSQDQQKTVPVASYNPDTDEVKPGYDQPTRMVTAAAFDALKPKPVSYEKAPYQDENGETRNGVFDPSKGKYITSPDDPKAPKPPIADLAEVRRQSIIQNAHKEFVDSLNPSQSKNPLYRQAGLQINAANRAKALIDQMRTQVDSGDKRQMLELARSVDRMLAQGGVPSERITNELVPKTLQGKIHSVEEFFTNNPTGLDQQAFVNRFADTIDRETKVSRDAVKAYQQEGFAKGAKLRMLDPQTWTIDMLNAGLDPTNIDERGVYKWPEEKPSAPPPSSGSGAKTAQDIINKWSH